MSDDWIENLKVGDKVIVSNRYSKKVTTVSRLTKTMIFADEIRFRKDGSQVGSYNSYNCFYLEEATDEAIQYIRFQVKLRKVISKLEETASVLKEKNPTYEQLEQLENVLNQYCNTENISPANKT